VRAAETVAERNALAERYSLSVEAAAVRGCAEVLRSFEDSACSSKAVIARPLAQTEQLTCSDDQLYSTYYKLIEAEVRLPSGDKWDVLRRVADAILFPGYEKEIRFAALSMDGIGASTYGECSLVLRDSMIAHRASVFEGNSAWLLKQWRYDLTSGFRATWEQRSMLCVAKLAAQLQAEATPEDFAEILLCPGPIAEEGRFVEVHILRGLTRRSLEKVMIASPPRGGRPGSTRLKALRDRLAEAGVAFEVS